MTMLPERDPVPATLRRELDDLWAAVKGLQTPRHREDTGTKFNNHEVVFSIAGAPTVGTPSPAYHVRHPTAYITEVRTSVEAGTSFTLAVLVNGDVETTLNYVQADEEGLHMVEDALMIEVEEWDRIRVRVDAASGVNDLTAQVVLSVPAAGE